MLLHARVPTIAALTLWAGIACEAQPPKADGQEDGPARDALAADADRVVDGLFDLKNGRERFTAIATKRQGAWREAAGRAEPTGMFLRGTCLLTGIGTDADPAESARLFRRAADGGSPHAQVMLGRISEGSDPKLALAMYEKAADAGFAWGEYRLGVAHSEGRIVRRDEGEAFRLVLKAAENGLAAAQTDVGSRFENANGTAKDEKKAFQWYLKAAEQDDPIGHLNLGVCYGRGIGTSVDREKTERHLHAAARLGVRLAYDYLDEFGLKPPPPKDKGR